ncbi:hypothetical protein GQ457_14G014660 [Hibiscus cannabinus]
MTKAPFNGKGERASDLLGLIHSDVCGPMNTQAKGGFQYFITFTNDFKRYGYIYLMRHKSEAVEKFKEFKNEVWGCKAFFKHHMSTKLEPKSQKCTFVGYTKETKGYYFYDPKENRVFVARTGVFLEKEFLSKKGSGRNIELEEVQQQQVHEPEVEDISQVVEENSTDLETQPLRRSTRECHEPERYGFLITTHADIILVDQYEPKTYQEAVSSPDSEKWLEARRSVMDSMSEIQTYKGRLVDKGFRQIHGVDYDKTFSPVAMFQSIRILLAIVAFHDYEIWQMDVKTAFLNGKLEEDVYMTQPEGFGTPENAGKQKGIFIAPEYSPISLKEARISEEAEIKSVKDLKPKRIKDYLECKISQRRLRPNIINRPMISNVKEMRIERKT